MTLELALSRTPTVVAYRVPKIEEFIVRRMAQITTAVLPNLILGQNAFPEFYQEDADAEPLAAALARIVDDGEPRRRQLAELEMLSDKMLLPDGMKPSEKAAQEIDELMGLTA